MYIARVEKILEYRRTKRIDENTIFVYQDVVSGRNLSSVSKNDIIEETSNESMLFVESEEGDYITIGPNVDTLNVSERIVVTDMPYDVASRIFNTYGSKVLSRLIVALEALKIPLTDIEDNLVIKNKLLEFDRIRYELLSRGIVNVAPITDGEDIRLDVSDKVLTSKKYASSSSDEEVQYKK